MREYDDDENGNKSYISAPSSLDFNDVLIDVLSTSPDEVLSKDLWNLCDVIALVIWTFSNDRGVLGVDKTLLSNTLLITSILFWSVGKLQECK